MDANMTVGQFIEQELRELVVDQFDNKPEQAYQRDFARLIEREIRAIDDGQGPAIETFWACPIMSCCGLEFIATLNRFVDISRHVEPIAHDELAKAMRHHLSVVYYG